MTPLSLQTPCPCCSGPLEATSLGCTRCQVKIEGAIANNEFASLSPEDLHLLRIFVWAEGKVREMEAPLGLTYPTIRSRLGQLKAKLRMEQNSPPEKDEVALTLDALESGELEFSQALELIKKRKKGKS
jgi:hypothetical protein